MLWVSAYPQGPDGSHDTYGTYGTYPRSLAASQTSGSGAPGQRSRSASRLKKHCKPEMTVPFRYSRCGLGAWKVLVLLDEADDTLLEGKPRNYQVAEARHGERAAHIM